jgi:hypothetical protein
MKEFNFEGNMFVILSSKEINPNSGSTVDIVKNAIKLGYKLCPVDILYRLEEHIHKNSLKTGTLIIPAMVKSKGLKPFAFNNHRLWTRDNLDQR